MKTTTTSIRTVTKSSRGGLGKPGVITTKIVSGQSGLRHSLRSSGSGKIWKKTVPGKKYEYAGKLREKRNYIMYHSGMGHEKNVIEEFEKIPEDPRMVEERQLIDNYEYYESKNLKKPKDPRRLSITRHQRLSSPFERVKKYEEKTSKPLTTVYTSSTTTTIKDGRGVGGGKDVLSKYNSFTSKQEKNYRAPVSNVYETYKTPQTKTSYTRTITTTSKSSRVPIPVKTTVKTYTTKTVKVGKPIIKTTKYVTTTSNLSKSKYQPNRSYLGTQPKSKKVHFTRTVTSSTTKRQSGGNNLGSSYILSRAGSAPKSKYF